MQVEDHAGYRDTDQWTRWLPEYETKTYSSKVKLCKNAIAYWYAKGHLARMALGRVKTDIARKRWNDREDWTRQNTRRWQNTLEDCMADEGVMKHFRVEK